MPAGLEDRSVRLRCLRFDSRSALITQQAGPVWLGRGFCLARTRFVARARARPANRQRSSTSFDAFSRWTRHTARSAVPRTSSFSFESGIHGCLGLGHACLYARVLHNFPPIRRTLFSREAHRPKCLRVETFLPSKLQL